ncbi:hypothetical protein PKB_1292 [Pseudomonas knackmussii B13]|uniref:Uncharacterized protein n=1 Tax=Pseudomonas knackmussii (strain DSM 6978 / CCUG 54928 / LMG 23759 / B13) TaxID=1301098 RepID=A0A024HDT9_PSEKB|nr:hypothetical protein [Pseudomonas knackmussii]CDF82657.1 hypothetical protein PKB_1292 [Pseudomonas knackmussii B13]
MPQFWLNNFSEPLVGALPSDEYSVLPLAQAALDELAALVPGKSEWVVLTLSSADGTGAREVIRYQPHGTTFQPLRRSQEGTAQLDWPAGTLCSCNVTAESMGRFENARGLLQLCEEATLTIAGPENHVSSWFWEPPEAAQLTLSVNGYGWNEGETPFPRQLIELWPTSTGPLVLLLPDLGSAHFDVPAGTTGINEDGSFTLTIPESPVGGYIIEYLQHGETIVRIQNYAGLTTF